MKVRLTGLTTQGKEHPVQAIKALLTPAKLGLKASYDLVRAFRDGTITQRTIEVANVAGLGEFFKVKILP